MGGGTCMMILLPQGGAASNSQTFWEVVTLVNSIKLGTG